MARRTRRNLSDPRIKKIVKEPARRQVSRKAAGARQKEPASSLNRSVAVLLILTILISLGYLFREPLARQINSLRNQFEQPKEVVDIKSDEAETAQNQQPAEQNSDPVIVDTPPAQEPQPVARRIQVEVLNGCGVDGVAKRMTRYLRSHQVDVVGSGNYKHFKVGETFILDRFGNTDRSRSVAELLGISTEQIQTAVAPELQLDATIVIGKDYKSLKAFSSTR